MNLALKVQQALCRDLDAGDLDMFRGARVDLTKPYATTGVGMSLYARE